MLNVVTGIFVDSAVCTRTDDEVVACWEEELQRTSEKVKQIFKEADIDCTGTLSFKELVEKLEDPGVKAYFSGLDIDPSEARIIYTLMDTDGDDSVSIDEFVNGTMKLKGQAKSIDVMALMFDQARFQVKFDQLCAFLQDQFQELVKKDAQVASLMMQAHTAHPLCQQNRTSRLRSPEVPTRQISTDVADAAGRSEAVANPGILDGAGHPGVHPFSVVPLPPPLGAMPPPPPGAAPETANSDFYL